MTNAFNVTPLSERNANTHAPEPFYRGAHISIGFTPARQTIPAAVSGSPREAQDGTKCYSAPAEVDAQKCAGEFRVSSVFAKYIITLSSCFSICTGTTMNFPPELRIPTLFP